MRVLQIILFGFALGAAVLQAADPPDLLVPVGSVAAAGAESPGDRVPDGNRTIRVRFSSEGLRHLVHPGATVAARTPDGVRRSIKIGEVRPLGERRFLVEGQVTGADGGPVTLALDGEVATGALQLADGTRFVLGGASSGDMEFSRADPTHGLKCAAEGPGSGMAAGLVSSAGGIVSGTAGVDPPVEVDVLVVYTGAALNGAGGLAGIRSLTDYAFHEANMVLKNSQVGLRLQVVGLVPVAYRDSGGIYGDLGALPGIVSTLRSTHRADLVMMIVEREDQGWDGVAGIGPAGGNSSVAYSVFRRAAVMGYPLVVHELGHLFGCSHDRQTNASDGGSGAYPDAHGHRFEADGVTYVTVMGYQPGISIPYFSNPDVLYRGVPTGIPLGQPQSADNARTLRLMAPIVANYQKITQRIEFATSAQSVSESAGSAKVLLRRTGLTEGTTSLTVQVGPGTAVSGLDFDGWTNVVEFGPGQSEREVVVGIHGDDLGQGPRTVELVLARPVSGTGVGIQSRMTLTLEDDDVPYEFSSGLVTVSEGGGPVELKVRRVGSFEAPGSALLGPLSGSEGADGQLRVVTELGEELNLPAVLEFAAGESERRLQLLALQDTEAEQDVSFTLQVTGSAVAQASPRSQVSVRVRDDDREAVLTTQFRPETHADQLGGPFLALPNGDLLLMVYPSGFDATEAAMLVRMHRDGRFDETFPPVRFQIAAVPDANFLYGWMNRMALQPDGRILVCGQFAAVNGIRRVGVVRLLPNGAIDPEFRTGDGPNGPVARTLVQPDGRILICGSFTAIDGKPRSKMARLNADGSLDETFRADAAPVGLHVFDIAFQGDRILACGMFSSINGVSRNNLCRLLPDGTVDTTFRGSTGGSTWEIYPLPDGRFYLRGLFRQPTQMIARFKADGTLDGTFRPAALTGYVFDLLPLPGDRLLVAGDLKQTTPATRNGVALLLPNGAVDPGFDLGLFPSGFVAKFIPGSSDELWLIGSIQASAEAPVTTLAEIRNFPLRAELRPPVWESGRLRISALGVRGLTHVLERSSDLLEWAPVETLFLDEACGVFSDPKPREAGLYRVRTLDP